MLLRRSRYGSLAAAVRAPRRMHPAIQQRGWLSTLPDAASSTADAALAAGKAPLDDDQELAIQAMRQLTKSIREAGSSETLQSAWDTLSRYEPVVFENGTPRVVSDTERESTDTLLLRMVSLAEMAELTRQGKREQVVERYPMRATTKLALESETGDEETVIVPIPIPADRVLQVSQEFVARKILTVLSSLDDGDAWAAFMDEYERLVAAVSDADKQALADYEQSNELARQSAENFRTYFSVSYAPAHLATPNGPAKIVARTKQFQSDLSRFVFNRDAFRSVLEACVKEREGELARALIDQAMDRFPIITFNSRRFMSAIHANLRVKPITHERLENAMHLYRRMHSEAGYIMLPRTWSGLFNAAVYVGDDAAAIEVFQGYRAHGIAPFQARFQQALRTVSRHERYELAIDMVKAWIRIESEPPEHPRLISDEEMRHEEGECLNRLVWEMAKGRPKRTHVEQVMRLMQEREVQAGAMVTRRLVSLLLREDSSPAAVLHYFFVLWESCPTVLLRTGFILYLVLEECAKHKWTDQYASVIQYAQEQRINLPFATITKLMENWEREGEFESSVLLGKLVLRAITPRHASAKHLPDRFFESLLRSLAFQQRFKDIIELDAAYELVETRATRVPSLARIIQDAKTIEY